MIGPSSRLGFSSRPVGLECTLLCFSRPLPLCHSPALSSLPSPLDKIRILTLALPVGLRSVLFENLNVIFKPRKQFIVGDDHDIFKPVRQEPKVVSLLLKRKLRGIASEDEAAR